jgi:hypothetical protein
MYYRNIIICTNAKKMEKSGLCTTAFRGDVIGTNKYVWGQAM